MTFSELLQVMAVSSLLTLVLAFYISRFGQQIKQAFERYAAPRYLKSHGVRRRNKKSTVSSEVNEPT